ncbi:hypothetical protein ACYX8G_19665 [Microbacterium saperdae]
MVKLIHSSPLGLLEIPDVGEVHAGEPFDAPDDLAVGLLLQTDLYRLASPAQQLRFDAEQRGIDTTGMKQAAIRDAIAAHDQEVSQ